MWFDLAAGWRKYNASLAVWGLRVWPLFGVESQPLLGVSKRIAGIGRDSVPSSLAVVESLTASRSPVVGRFDCIYTRTPTRLHYPARLHARVNI